MWRIKADKIEIPVAEIVFYGLLGNSKWHSLPEMTEKLCPLLNFLPFPPLGNPILNLISFSCQWVFGYDTKSTGKNKKSGSI